MENQEAWSKGINHYDLLVDLDLNGNFGELIQINDRHFASLEISPNKKNLKSVEQREFLAEKFLVVDGQKFTIQDFVLAISYHGSFHLEANDRPELKILYRDFIEQNSAICMDLCFQISEVLINGFEEIRNKFGGNNDAYSSIRGRQPMIVEAGSLICFQNGQTAQRFKDSYMQIPVRRQEGCGIRICIDLELIAPVGIGHVFSYGHRQSKTQISLNYNNGVLMACCTTDSEKHVFTLKITDKLVKEMHKIELSVYSNGSFIIAVNEEIKGTHYFDSSFQIENGKIMLGSDLSGNKSGIFLNSCLSLEAINPYHQLKAIFLGGNLNLKTNNDITLHEDSEPRPCLKS
jgi:hypothetical protein